MSPDVGDRAILYPFRICIFSQDWNFGFNSFFNFVLRHLSVLLRQSKMALFVQKSAILVPVFGIKLSLTITRFRVFYC